MRRCTPSLRPRIGSFEASDTLDGRACVWPQMERSVSTKQILSPANLLLAVLLAAGGSALAQQPQQQQTIPPSAPPPITDQTPVTPGQSTTSTAVAPTLSKKELKAQRKQQKAAEKAASENAKAQKDQANALKHQDKATDASQRANPPQ